MERATLPRWAKGLVAYVALVALGALVGALTPLRAGEVVFVLGALVILYSLTFIRLGGPLTVISRPLRGKPVWGVDPERRGRELRDGFAVFALGAALWATLAVAWLVGRPI